MKASMDKFSNVKCFFSKAKTYLGVFVAILSMSALFGKKADAQCRLFPFNGDDTNYIINYITEEINPLGPIIIQENRLNIEGVEELMGEVEEAENHIDIRPMSVRSLQVEIVETELIVPIDPEPAIELQAIELLAITDQRKSIITESRIYTCCLLLIDKPEISIEVTDEPESINTDEETMTSDELVIDESQLDNTNGESMIVGWLEIGEPIQDEIREIVTPANYNPVVQVQIEEPIVLANPFLQKPVQKISCIGLYRPLKKYKLLLGTQAIKEQSETIQIEEAVEDNTPIEPATEETLDSDEDTRETLEPLADSRIILSVYPNPTTDYFNVQFNGDGQFLLEMYDGRGRQVKITKLESNLSRVETSNLEPGSYLVRISNAKGDQVETKTIIVI